MTRRLLAPALVVLAAWLATAPALDGSFVYDDAQYLVENPAVTGGASPWATPLGHPDQGLWRPVTVLSWRLQWAGPDDAGPLRLGNVLLHVAASLLVLAVARRVGLGATAAGVAGVLFAVHPVHAEAVAWVTGRAELLATCFVLAGWLAWLRDGPRATATAVACLVLAGLSKENALAAPALWVLGDVLLPDRRVRWARVAAPAAAVAAVFLARLAVLPGLLPATGPFDDVPLAGRLVVALGVLGRALRLLVWPHPLRVEYQRQEFLTADLADLAAVALLLAAVVRLWRPRPLVALGLASVPVALLPVLNLVPIGEAFAERFLYLPSAGLCVAAAAAFRDRARVEVASGRGAGGSVLALLLVVLAAIPASRAATRVFRDDLGLWMHAAESAPDLPLVRYNLGLFLDREGHHLPEDAGRPGCMEELRASLELDPHHVYAGFAHQMLGTHALGAGGVTAPPDAWRAAEHFRAAVELLPGLVEARLNLATIALDAPDVVGPVEALAYLAPVTVEAGADPEQVLGARELERQLSAERSGSSSEGGPTGTSSPDGS